MTNFLDEIFEQPQSLRQFSMYYEANRENYLTIIPTANQPILTGMGASFHAARAMTFYLQSLGIRANAMEATELFQYGLSWLKTNREIIYVSQSGSSAEVLPIVSQKGSEGVFIAITNTPDCVLTDHARFILPLVVDHETTVATKTYINSLACLWLLGRQWTDRIGREDFAILNRLADEIQAILDQSMEITRHWLESFSGLQTVIFTGAGPHAFTARQAAQTVAEWAKTPVIGLSSGALRHGYIETVGPNIGVVLFAPPGQSFTKTLALAEELQGYGARVLLVQNGWTREVHQPNVDQAVCDEFLSPILDVIPTQLYAEALARHHGVEPGFRYLSKVVTKL